MPALQERWLSSNQDIFLDSSRVTNIYMQRNKQGTPKSNQTTPCCFILDLSAQRALPDSEGSGVNQASPQKSTHAG